jgi:hypothetical protein
MVSESYFDHPVDEVQYHLYDSQQEHLILYQGLLKELTHNYNRISF